MLRKAMSGFAVTALLAGLSAFPSHAAPHGTESTHTHGTKMSTQKKHHGHAHAPHAKHAKSRSMTMLCPHCNVKMSRGKCSKCGMTMQQAQKMKMGNHNKMRKMGKNSSKM